MSFATTEVMEERRSIHSRSSLPPGAFQHAGTLPLTIPPFGRYPQPRELIDMGLFELDPREVVDGVLLDNGLFLAPDPTPVGGMRETCPYCDGEPLQLVLRRHHVKRTHLFCQQCTRCFDVLGMCGCSMLDIV